MAARLRHLVKRKFLEIGATWRWILFEVIVIVVAANLILYDPDDSFDRSIFGNNMRVFSNDINISNTEYFK